MAQAKYPVLDGKKVCRICGVSKPEEQFYQIRQRGFVYRDNKCDDCRKQYNARYAKKWYAEHPNASRDYNRKWKAENKDRHDFLMWRSHVKRKYGLSTEQAHALLENPACAICGTIDFNGRRPLVDHCHKTKKFRGLLCINCNRAIERVESIPNWCEKALAYLNA